MNISHKHTPVFVAFACCWHFCPKNVALARSKQKEALENTLTEFIYSSFPTHCSIFHSPPDSGMTLSDWKIASAHGCPAKIIARNSRETAARTLASMM
jgi:hypothetical protein